MNQTWKIALVVWAFLLTAGCSGSVAEPTAVLTTTPTAAPTAVPTREAGGLMCIIVPGIENPYFNTQQEIAAQKAEELGYEALELVHDDDANKEGELIDSCISQEAVAIILNKAGRDATIANVQKAADAGIPVFLIDREIYEDGIAISQIVSNHYRVPVFFRLLSIFRESSDLVGAFSVSLDETAGRIHGNWTRAYFSGILQVSLDRPSVWSLALAADELHQPLDLDHATCDR